jgi:3-deoxy-D-manno-octulosonic-acid transferase
MEKAGRRGEKQLLLLYDIVLIVILLFYAPILFFSKRKDKKEHQWQERFGFIDPELVKRFKAQKTIWIHAASVGETVIAKQLVVELKKEYPDYQILFSVMTATGKKMVEESLENRESVIFLPLDISFIVRKVVRQINPELLILIETELWPNLINEVHRFGGRVLVASGRIGDKSLTNYQYIKPLLKRALFMVDSFSMQSRMDAERIISLGAPEDKVLVNGNIKYDRDFSKTVDRDLLYRRLNIDKERPVLLAGSTHDNEEKQLLEVYKKLKQHFPELLMIIAPRYIDRTEEIKKVYVEQGIKAVSWSKEIDQLTEDAVIIVDTFGELAGLYKIATLVFVGGSLIPKGGHNILEPAAYGRAVFVGPHMFNFKEDTKYFLAADVLIQVNNSDELARQMIYYLNNQDKLDEKGKKAGELIQSNKGALRVNLEQINYLLIRKPKILIVRLSAIGDVIHALPVAFAIKEKFPNAELNWLAEDRVVGLISLNPYVDKIIVMPRKQWQEIAKKNKWQALKAVVSFLKGLRNYNFDLVLDLHGFFKSALPVGMTKAPLRYGNAGAAEGSILFYNRKIKIPSQLTHKIDRYLYMTKAALGVSNEQVRFAIEPSSSDKVKVTKLLEEYSLRDRKFVVINPYTTWKTKDWIVERYRELAGRIKKELDYEAVFTGDPGNRKGIDTILETSSVPVSNLAGLTNLGELAELYKRAELFIGGDTGPMHLAVAVGLPVVVIMGPTDPKIYGPYGNRNIVVRDDHSACLGCWKRKCPHNQECMNNVSVEQVFVAVQKILGVKK